MEPLAPDPWNLDPASEVNVLRRIIWLFVGAPIVLVLVALGVVNDQPVSLVLDPFQPTNPTISVRPLPFFLYFFGALIVGVVAGGLATWLTQTRWRRGARHSGAETQRWKAEVERLNRERQRETTRQLA
jgi:uncharacterized membrane protein YeaQ/YmgE (transglycosylase-associated protein family)